MRTFAGLITNKKIAKTTRRKANRSLRKVPYLISEPATVSTRELKSGHFREWR